jgi:hypothetical protein
MVATKMLISLCFLGLARAAPQLGAPNNANGIVTEVVGALQPQIAAAVAEALRGLNLSGSRASTSNFGSSSSSTSNNFNSRGSSSQTGFATGNNQQDISVPASYAYEYKVGDEEEQTYITHNEARDGDDVTGTYSYVDPTGALITVNYQAGAMGYTQTMERQDGAVTIRSKAGSSNSASSSSRNSASSSSSNSAFNSASSGSANASGSRFSSNQVQQTSSSSVDESALIARIIAALGPQINSAVNSAVSSQQQSSFTTSNTGFSATSGNTGFAASAAGDRLTPLFGN